MGGLARSIATRAPFPAPCVAVLCPGAAAARTAAILIAPPRGTWRRGTWRFRPCIKAAERRRQRHVRRAQLRHSWRQALGRAGSGREGAR